MLSGPVRAMRAPRARQPAPVAFARAEAGVRFTLAGVEVEACRHGGLWIEAAGALIVSDLHLEKGSAFGARGQFLPPYDTRATLERLAALIAWRKPRRVISLGDSLHDRGAVARMDAGDAARLRDLVSAAEWVWVEGNHDSGGLSALGGVVADTVELSGLLLRHEPTGAAGEVAGHLHPCARVAGRGRAVRARCFATDGARLVMPAFGAYTGGLNVRDPAFDAVFPNGRFALAMGRDGVHPAAGASLAPDGV